MNNPIHDRAVRRLAGAYRRAGGTVNKADIFARQRHLVEKDILAAFTADDDGTKEADAERADIVQMVLNDADRSLTGIGSRTIKKLIAGEQPFPEICDVIVPLGGGDRCSFGAMGAAEWERWDTNQYQNLVDAQDAYRGFRKLFDQAKPFLRAGKRTSDFWPHLGGVQ